MNKTNMFQGCKSAKESFVEFKVKYAKGHPKSSVLLVRRFRMRESDATDLGVLTNAVNNVKEFSLFWFDQEKDAILITTDSELKLAVECLSKSRKFYESRKPFIELIAVESKHELVDKK